MSAAVSSFRFPVSSDEAQGLKPGEFGHGAARLKSCPDTSCPDTQKHPDTQNCPDTQKLVSRFTFQVSRGGALRESGMEMPSVVAASRLADRPAAAMVLSGIEALDALTGGLPRGGLTEICGPASSGRTRHEGQHDKQAQRDREGQICQQSGRQQKEGRVQSDEIGKIVDAFRSCQKFIHATSTRAVP